MINNFCARLILPVAAFFLGLIITPPTQAEGHTTPEIQLFLERDCNYTPEQIALFEGAQEKTGIVLDKFLAGKIYSEQPYTKEEIALILADLKRVIDKQFTPETYSDNPTYITTAGAPGTGKSTYLENIHGTNPTYAVYTDPDRVGTPSLTGYNRDRAEHGSGYAYTKWRDASNFIANFMLVKAAAESRNIVHGTTATSPRVAAAYKKST